MKRLRFMLKASQLGLFGGETPTRPARGLRPKGATSTAPAPTDPPKAPVDHLRPPGPGWLPIPGSKHGGMHRKKPDGTGYDYWYPSSGVVSRHHDDDTPAPAPAPAPTITPSTSRHPVADKIRSVIAAAHETADTLKKYPTLREQDAEAARMLQWLLSVGVPQDLDAHGLRHQYEDARTRLVDERDRIDEAMKEQRLQRDTAKPAQERPRHRDDWSPDQAGPLHRLQSLAQAELAIANEAHEHAVAFAGDGLQIARMDPANTLRLVPGVDTRKACAVEVQVREALKRDGNGIFSHNHPSGSAFSEEDVAMAIECNVKEMRATTSDGTWVLPRPQGGWPAQRDAAEWVRSDMNQAMKTAFAEMNQIVIAAGGNPNDGQNAKGFDPEAWRRLSKEATTRAWKYGQVLTAHLPIRFESHAARSDLAAAVPAARPAAKPKRMRKGGRLCVRLSVLRKAEQLRLWGADSPPQAAATPRRGAPKPPAGFMPIAGSQHGGHRKPKEGGGYEYWYPPDSGVLKDKGATKTAALEMLGDHPLSVAGLTHRVAPDDQSGAPGLALHDAVHELHREGKVRLGGPNASGDRVFHPSPNGTPRPKLSAAERDHRTVEGVAREEILYGPGTAGDRAPLAKAQVRGHVAQNPGGRGVHQVRSHDRWGPIADGAAPFGSHANWLTAHQKLLAASTARLAEGRYPQARALYDLAHQVRWNHDSTFHMNDRITEDPGAPIHAEASRAYYTMQYPKERHPIELFHDVLAGRNKLGRADKVHKHFHRDRDYDAASAAYDQGDRSALDSWWRAKIASFEGNEELTKYIADSIAKWREGFKVAPTDPNRCDRCGGKGHMPAFKHVSGGECFECGGSGTKDVHMGEVLRKAIALPCLRLQPMAKGVSSLTVQTIAGGGEDAWMVGPYSFRLSKGQSGVSILTVTGGNLPQPYHLVVRGRADARSQSTAVAKAFSEGRIPDEGVFRREGLAPVRYGAA